MDKKIDIDKELESTEYKKEYERHINILNSFMQCLTFTNLNCSRRVDLREKLFFLSVIDDIYQSIVAIKLLSKDGIRNTCRRELRYLIELSIKACIISQQKSEKSVEEQIIEFRKIIQNTNNSQVKDIDFYFLSEPNKVQFFSEISRMYGDLCLYVHTSQKQMQERVKLIQDGRTIGLEGINELRELNSELGKSLSLIIVLFFHAIPSWCVGDYMVENDGKTVNSYFSKSKYFAAEIDSKFVYKHERQKDLYNIINERTSKIEV